MQAKNNNFSENLIRGRSDELRDLLEKCKQLVWETGEINDEDIYVIGAKCFVLDILREELAAEKEKRQDELLAV